MTDQILQSLASFSVDSNYATLPAPVVDEVKRLTLEIIGCALGGVSHPKGTLGILRAHHGRRRSHDHRNRRPRIRQRRGLCQQRAMGRCSTTVILPPGHVSPHAVPVALAAGESVRANGKDVIAALAVAHEMSCRLGNAMSQNRDVVDGQSANAPVLGYTCTVLGTAAVAGLLARTGPCRHRQCHCHCCRDLSRERS